MVFFLWIQWLTFILWRNKSDKHEHKHVELHLSQSLMGQTLHKLFFCLMIAGLYSALWLMSQPHNPLNQSKSSLTLIFLYLGKIYIFPVLHLHTVCLCMTFQYTNAIFFVLYLKKLVYIIIYYIRNYSLYVNAQPFIQVMQWYMDYFWGQEHFK